MERIPKPQNFGNIRPFVPLSLSKISEYRTGLATSMFAMFSIKRLVPMSVSNSIRTVVRVQSLEETRNPKF
jgi:hypothetical protein